VQSPAAGDPHSQRPPSLWHLPVLGQLPAQGAHHLLSCVTWGVTRGGGSLNISEREKELAFTFDDKMHGSGLHHSECSAKHWWLTPVIPATQEAAI
jgi:hypothetical protein